MAYSPHSNRIGTMFCLHRGAAHLKGATAAASAGKSLPLRKRAN